MWRQFARTSERQCGARSGSILLSVVGANFSVWVASLGAAAGRLGSRSPGPPPLTLEPGPWCWRRQARSPVDAGAALDSSWPRAVLALVPWPWSWPWGGRGCWNPPSNCVTLLLPSNCVTVLVPSHCVTVLLPTKQLCDRFVAKQLCDRFCCQPSV